MDKIDPVLAQLRKLREGVGLTSGRLAACGAVMSALGTSDGKEAYDRLLAAIARLGDSDRARALRVDYSIDLPQLLEREPTRREVELLGERRNGYGTVIGRDGKTLGRWSDKAVADLCSQLLDDTFRGELFVVAAVRADRILGCTLIQQESGQEQPVKRSSIEIDNPAPGASLPCLVYGFPRDWRPRSLTLVAAFQGDSRPSAVTALVADSFFALAFAEERHELTIDESGTAVCTFKGPRRDQLYALWWR